MATIADGVIGFIVIGVPLLVAFGKKSTVNTTGGTSTTYSISDPKWLALWAALAVLYYVIFEATLAATPGKLVLGLRVRQASGERCTVRQVFVRNAIRVIDAFPYVVPYLVGAVAIWTSDGPPQNCQRLGDRAAGTIVIYR
jgi:uncharacterized RDD family membrane protein YckC